MEDISRRSYQEVLGFGGGFFSSDDDIVRIGVLLPLSGSSKKLGESLKNAALLRITSYNVCYTKLLRPHNAQPELVVPSKGANWPFANDNKDLLPQSK